MAESEANMYTYMYFALSKILANIHNSAGSFFWLCLLWTSKSKVKSEIVSFALFFTIIIICQNCKT